MKKIIAIILATLLLAGCGPTFHEATETEQILQSENIKLREEIKELQADNEELAARAAELETIDPPATDEIIAEAFGYSGVVYDETEGVWCGYKYTTNAELGDEYELHENHVLGVTSKSLVIKTPKDEAVSVAEKVGSDQPDLVKQYSSVMISSDDGFVYLSWLEYNERIVTICTDFTDDKSLEKTYWDNDFCSKHDISVW